MTWEYRVIRHFEAMPGGKIVDWLTIHRVYYNGDRITSWEPMASTYGGETLEELAENVELMRLALDKPVLRAEDMPK
jgi:hypothetical protein